MRLVPLDETDEDAVGAATANMKLVPYEGLLEGEEAPQRTWGEALSDAWYQYAEGANRLVGAVPNLIAPDSDVAQTFSRYADDWRSKQSKSLRMRYADADERISQAGQGGLLSQAGTAAREFAQDPALAARSITTNLPSMVLGGALAKGVQGAGALLGLGASGAAGLATGASGAFNSMMNAGDARGDAYESLKRAHLEQGASEEEATRQALEGSWTPALIGGAAGFISGKTGLEKAIVGGGGGVGRAVARAAKSAAAEMLGEQAEEVLPQMATNYAVGQVDGTTGLMQDIGRTMVETAIASGPGSALSGVAESRNPAERIQSNINRASDMLRQMDDVQAAVHESARQASAQAQAQGLDDIGSAESVEQAISAARRAVSVNDDELLRWAYQEAGIDPAELDAARTQAQAEIDSGQQMLDANRTAQERMQAQMDTAAPAASEPAAPESAASEPAAPVQETSAAAEPSAEVTPLVEPIRQEQRASPEVDAAPAAPDMDAAHDRSPDTASATATPQAKAQAGQTAAALSSEEWRQKTREAIDASLAREALPEGIKRLHDEGTQQLASGLSSASDPEAFIRDTIQRIQDWPARYDEAKGKNRHVPQEILDEKHRLQGMFNAVGFKPGKATTAQDFERALRAYTQKQQGDTAPAAAAQTAHAARGTAPMLSRSEPTKANYEKRIDELFAGAKANLQGARVLDRSDVLGLLGHAGKPVLLAEGKVLAGRDNHPHMTAAVWKKVPEWLENPAAVFDSETDGGLVFLAPQTLGGRPVSIIVRPDALHGGALQAHLLVNAYDRSGATPFTRWANDGLLRFADTKKFPALVEETSGRRLPGTALQNKPGTRRILTERSLAGWRQANAPAASRTASPAAAQAPAQPTRASAAPATTSAPASGRSLSPSLARRTAALQQAVDAIHARWPNAPQTVVVADMQDARIPQAVRDADQAQKSQGARGEPEGFFVGGKVYLVASQVKTAQDAARVLAHEVLGHHGLRGLYGPQLSSVLDRAGLALRPRVAAKAREYGLHGLGDAARQATNGQVWQSMTKEQRHQAAEEVLAEMAQEQPQLGLVRQLVAAIRSWLRAHVPGFSGLRVSDDEIIRDYILPARGWVIRGQRADKASNQDVRFLRVWHGTPYRGIEQEGFDLERIGSGEGSHNHVIWDQDALGDAADITPMFSRSKQTQAQYEKRIDELFAGGKASRVGARVLDRSDVLELIGYGSRPMVLQESKVLKGIDNHPHMTAAVWKKVPEWLENPAAVFDSDTESGRLVFVAPEPVNGAPVAMIVEPTPTASGGAQMAVSLLVNAYDRSGATPFMRWIGDGLMRYADTKKFPAVFTQSVGRRLPDTAFQNKPGTRKILTEKNLAGWRQAHAQQPDVRFRRSQEAGESSADKQFEQTARAYGGEAAYSQAKEAGQTELSYRQWVQVRTPAFKAWFGDWENDPDNASKVVNPETGEPLVVYHGTNADFSVFEQDKLGENTFSNANHTDAALTAVLGHWFNSADLSQSHSSSFDRSKAVFLNIRQAQEFDSLQALMQDMDDHVPVDEDGRRLPDVADFDDLQDLADIGSQVQQGFREDGYDGIVVWHDDEFGQTSYIAFDANQIKSATDNSGAFDEASDDIRFSRSEQTRANYEKRIDELFAGDPASRKGARILDRSDVMGLLGHPDVPLVLAEPHLLDGMKNHPEMTAQAWKQVPDWLENPAAVYTDPQHAARLTVIAPERLAGYPVIMAVEPNPGRNPDGHQKPTQLLVTAFAKTTGRLPDLRYLAQSGRLQYADTKTAPIAWPNIGDNPRAFGPASGAKRILTEKNLAGWRKVHAPQKQPDVRFSRTTEESSADETYSYEQGWLDGEPYKPLSIPLNAQQRQLVLDTFNEHTEGPHFSDIFDVEQSHDINAKSRAFQALVQSEGWHIDPRAAGDKYFLIGNKPLTRNGTWVDTLTIPVRVSDHSNVNRGNHFHETAINIAPDDGFAFDTFESALWKIRNASESEDGDLLFGGEEPVMFSRSADPQSDLLDPERNRPQGFELPEETRQQRLRRKLQDYFLRALVVQDAVARQGGKVSEGNDFYLAEELSHGRRAARVNDFARNTVQPLVQKAARLRVDLDELALYAYAKHAPERNARIAEINPDMPDGGSGMSNDEAAAILQKAQSEGKQQALDELHADLMAIAQQTRSLMQDEGLITQKEYDTLEGMYENYIPLRGFEQTDEEGNEAPASARRGSGKGFNVRGKETMRALGRSSRAGLLIENLLSDYQRAVDRAERNHVAKVFLQFVRQNPDRKLWQINAKATKQAYNRQTGRVERHTAIDKGEDTIAVKVGGREVYVKVKDELLARALRLAHKDETGESERLLMRTVGLYSSLLRNTLTRYNPEFALTNAARDFTFGAAAVLDALGEKGAAKYLKHYAGALKAAHRDFKNTQDPAHNEWDQWFRRYQMAGGSTAGFYVKSAEQISKDLRDIALTAGVAAPRTKMEKLKMSQAGAAARKLGNILEWAGSVSEHAARVAAFRAAVEMGQSQAKAASIAKNLTTNFDRKGEMGQLVNTFYVFFNAAVQGSHRTLKMMANPKIRHYMAGMTASAVTLAFVAASWGGDDPDDGIAYWDKIPAHVKERNLIIPLPASVQLDGEQQTVGTNGNYIAIPLQYGLNLPVAFGYAVADAMRNMADPSRGRSLAQAAAHMAGAVAGAFNPLGGSVDLGNGSSVAQALLPSVGDAIVQFATGTDAFGKDVAPYKRPGDIAPDSENYNVRQTGSASLAIARALNRATGGNEAESGLIDVSAGSVENLINNLAGGSGKFLYDALNFAWKGMDWATGNDPELYLRDVPIARRLGGALNGEIDQGIYNANQRKVQEAAGVVKRSVEADIDPSEDNITLARMDKHATKIGKKLADLRRKMKRVLEDEDMTRGDKTILLRQIRMQRDALTAQFNADFTAVMREAAQQAKAQP